MVAILEQAKQLGRMIIACPAFMGGFRHFFHLSGHSCFWKEYDTRREKYKLLFFA